MSDSREASAVASGVQTNLKLGNGPVSSLGGTSAHPARPSAWPMIIILLLNVAILALLLGRSAPARPSPAEATASAAINGNSGFSSEAAGSGDEALALNLEERSLWNAAAAEWLAAAQRKSDPTQRANAYYRAGTLFEKAPDPERAAATYVAAERLLSGDDHAALKSKIGLRIIDCLRVLGRNGELGRELARRAEAEKGSPENKAQAKVLAYIGDDPVTDADLEHLIEAQVDRLLAMNGTVDPAAREKYLKQFETPQQRKPLLEELLKQEVLVRRARELGLDREEEIRQGLQQFERAFLSEMLLRKEILARLAVTPEDLKNYFSAHASEFKGPSTAQLSLIELKDKAAAAALHEQLKDQDEAAFEKVAREQSLHTDSKVQGGKVETPYLKGTGFIGLPKSADLDAVAFEKPLKKISDPLEIGGRFFLVLARSRELDPQLPYEKVEQRVQSSYVQAKQRELSDVLVKDLQSRYAVRLEHEPAPPETKTAKPGN